MWVSVPLKCTSFFFFRTILSEQELQQQQQHQLHSYSDKKLLTVPVNRDSAVSTCCCGNPNISGLMEELTSQHIEFHEIHWKQQKGMVWARLLKYQSLRSAQTYLDSSDLPFLTANFPFFSNVKCCLHSINAPMLEKYQEVYSFQRGTVVKKKVPFLLNLSARCWHEDWSMGLMYMWTWTHCHLFLNGVLNHWDIIQKCQSDDYKHRLDHRGKQSGQQPVRWMYNEAAGTKWGCCYFKHNFIKLTFFR